MKKLCLILLGTGTLLILGNLTIADAEDISLSNVTNILTPAKFAELYPTTYPTTLKPNSCSAEKIAAGGCYYGDDPAATKYNYAKDAATYYSYANFEIAYDLLFIKQAYKAPFSSGNKLNDYRELAAILANINQETNGSAPPRFSVDGKLLTTNTKDASIDGGAGALGVGYGLTAVTEGSCLTSGKCVQYGTKTGFCNNTDTAANIASACGSSELGFCKLAKKYCASPTPVSAIYYGRGAKQLTYAYNYVFYGSKIYPQDVLYLADNPNLLNPNPEQKNTNGVVGWATGLAYWSIPFEEGNGKLKPSMSEGLLQPTKTGHTEFDNEVGFGKTINIINGGVECGRKNQYIRGTTLNRINNYIELMMRLDPTAVNNVVVYKNNGVIDTYTNTQLSENINNNLIKRYTDKNGKEQTMDYADYQPSWAYGKWSNGRYNSFALLQEYYYAANTPNPEPPEKNYYNNGSTTLEKIVMHYNNGSSERLDCSRVMNYEGN